MFKPTYQELVEALKRCHDEADHILGTESYTTASKLKVARRNAKTIKAIVKDIFERGEKP